MRRSLLKSPPENVYVVDDWYDGPRTGYADYQSEPHFYRSVFLDYEKFDHDENRFELTPVSQQVVKRALESHRLWSKWDEAYREGTSGQVASDEPRILPEDQARYEELCARVEQERAKQSVAVFTVCGEFESGFRRVRWYGLDGVVAERD